MLMSPPSPQSLFALLQEGLQTNVSNPVRGRPPWNKGRKMSEATRQKISITQKKRWTEAPVRAARTSKLKASLRFSALLGTASIEHSGLSLSCNEFVL